MRLLALLLSLVSGLLSAAPAKQPNIVFIFSDDHAYQAISAYGDSRKLNQTPNIDRLAKEGMRFDRALVTNSCLLYTSPSPRDGLLSRMPSSA